MLYSPSTHGFYSAKFHGKSIPADAVEISDEDYAALAARGFPVTVDAAELTAEQLAKNERAWRDGELSGVKWLRERHRDQLEIEVETTLKAEQFRELLVYIQALRDWPQSPDFSVLEQRPAAPPWIAEQTQ